MALETLVGVHVVGGFDIVDMGALKDTHPEMFRPDGSMHYHLFEEKIRPFNFVYVRHDVNSISFTLQNGPIKEKGVNGCQVDTLIHVARLMLEGLDKQFPCEENKIAMAKLDGAIAWLASRTKDREARQVEGTSRA